MMTSTNYHDMFTADRDAARKTVKGWREAVATLDSIQNNDVVMSETPAHTIKCFVAEVGEDLARFVVASLVNRSAWDGRIYPNVKKWAEGVENSLDEDACLDAMINTNMHMSHLNQIAQAMMQYQPEPAEEVTEATETESGEPAAALAFTISHNDEFNSTEVSFSGKPSEEIRSALKALRFRWHSKRRVWYGYATEEAARAAIAGKPVEAEKNQTSKAATIDRDMLRREFSKAWDSPKMIDFCTNKVAAVAVLPGGEIITVDKQGIEKEFCFGESGYDYDEASAAAAHARTSESYFKSENMKYFREWMKDLEEARTMSGNYALVIGTKHYSGQAEDCKLAFVEFVRLSEIVEACGGSCYLEELPGKVLTVRGCERRVATAEEIQLIIDAYKAAAAQHEKKVDSYLKRYGTSKVHAWTYWRDA